MYSLREEMAAWSDWLAIESPPWVAYCAIMKVRLFELEKCLGVIPSFIGWVFHRLTAKLHVRDGGVQVKKACGCVKLCAGLEAGIEEAIQTVKELEEL